MCEISISENYSTRKIVALAIDLSVQVTFFGNEFYQILYNKTD